MSDNCIFCKISRGELPAVKLYEDDTVLAFMDIHPLRRGHALVIPRQHQQRLQELPASTQAALIQTAAGLARALYASSLAPAAVHYMVNDGPAAQQTVPHVHLHVLPRYPGDNIRFLARLLRKPLDLLIGPTSAQRLRHDADIIRAAWK